MTTYKPSENIAYVGGIDPDANATGAISTDYVDMEFFENLLAVVQVGIIAASGTVDFKLRQATSATGAGVKDISSKAITQMATGDNDEQALVNLRADELDLANNFRYAVGVMTTTTAAGDSAVAMLGYKHKHGVASDHDIASVGEIVA